MRLDEDDEALLRLALLADQEHPETIEDYAAGCGGAGRGHGPAGSAPA